MADRMKKGAAKSISFTGFIQEIELEDGEMGLQINDGDHVYRIVMDKTGSKLSRYVDEEVDVTGLLTHTTDSSELKVNTFRLTEGLYYDDDDAYDQEGGHYDEDDRFSY